LVNVIRRPISDVEDVVKTLIMHERSTVLRVGLEDPAEYESIAGRIRKLQDIG